MLEKIRKLLALAADPNAAPNEAATAARQAAALMAKHDLDLNDLEDAELKAQWDMTTMQGVGCRPGKKNAKEVPSWIGVIGMGVRIFTRTRISEGAGYVTFKGPRTDVALAVWLHDYIVSQAYEASKGRSISDANAFRMGYAGAIQARMKEMAKNRDQADVEVVAGTGTSLIRVQDSREQEMNALFGKQGVKSAKGRQSDEGRQAGMKASIPTGRPISSGLRLR